MPTTIAELSPLLNKIIRGPVVSQLNENNVPLSFIVKHQAMRSGSISENIQLTRNTFGGTYASGANITADTDVVEANFLEGHRRIAVPFKIAGDALAAAKLSNTNGLMDLFVQKVQQSSLDLGQRLATQFYLAAPGVNDMSSLFTIASNTGIYGGISRVTYPTWRANVLLNGGTGRALTTDLMQQAFTETYKQTGRYPTKIVTTPDLLDRYERIFSTYAQEPRTSTAPAMTGFGAMMLHFKTVPVVADHLMPAGNMFFFAGDDAVEFHSMPIATDSYGAGLKPEIIRDANNKITAQVGLQMLGQQGDAISGFLYCYGNYMSRYPNRITRLGDLI
jgi:hypothetical protein